MRGQEGRERIQLCSFIVGGQEFALDIMKIREIINPVPVRPVPRSPAFVEGVIDLRGAILPVVDLRQRLGQPPAEPDRSRKIIIATVQGRPLGLIVDAVREVLRISPGDVQPPPAIAVGAAGALVSGMCSLGGRILLLLDVEGLLTAEERGGLEALAPAAPGPEEKKG